MESLLIMNKTLCCRYVEVLYFYTHTHTRARARAKNFASAKLSFVYRFSRRSGYLVITSLDIFFVQLLESVPLSLILAHFSFNTWRMHLRAPLSFFLFRIDALCALSVTVAH